MTRDEIIRMAQEAGADCEFAVHIPAWDMSTWEFMKRFAALVAEAERDRTARLVADMQAELQTLRARLARQKPVLWVFKDNPGLTTTSEPGNKDLWEPLGPIV